MVLCVHQLVVHAAEDLGRATHHRLYREKVVRPRCAVRLASIQALWWSMACSSSLGKQSAAQLDDPNLGTNAPQGSDRPKK